MSQLLSKGNLHVNDNQHFSRDKRNERDDNFYSLVIDDQKQQTESHSLMLPWFKDLMNVTEEVTIHRPNVSTLLSSAFIRGDLNKRSFYTIAHQQPFFLTRHKWASGSKPPLSR